MIDAQKLLNRLNKLHNATYAQSLQVRNYSEQVLLWERIKTIEKIQAIVEEMEGEK